jgi:ATP-binding cassette subfamily B protein/subfamily B ATP-binding cassette protein MsbA
MGALCLWALRHAARRRLALSAVLSTMLVTIGLDLLKPWPMKILVDHVLQGDPLPDSLATAAGWLLGPFQPEDLIGWCVAATVVLFLATWLCRLCLSLLSINLGQRLVYDLAGELLGHLHRLSLRFHSRHSVGDSMRRVTGDCGCVATIVKDALLPVLTSVVSLCVMFAIMWQLDASLTLLSLLVVPCMIAVFRRYAGPMMECSYQQHEVEGEVYDVVEQTLSAIPVVQAFGRERQAEQRFRGVTRRVVEAALALASVQMRFKVLMGASTALGTAAIIWVGANHVLDGKLSVGSILVFLSYLASLYGPLEALMYTSSTIQGAAGSARRVLEILETQPEVADCPGAVALSVPQGLVRMENVTFGYEPGRPVLREVTLQVQPGQTVALVGATGAGKTTLASLIPRFFDPWNGRVTIDGMDIREVRVQSLRVQVGLVLQDAFLFPLTIAENIAYGSPHASHEKIEAAARAANAHDFIERLPDGYNTLVGQRGATLSGGERQRLSIARAFLKNAPILILDEPTSALDVKTEKLLLDALSRLLKGRTTIIIAHRLSTIRHADGIVVLHEGKVVESGTHDELIAAGGRYAYLYALQHQTPSPLTSASARDRGEGLVAPSSEVIDA